MFLHLHEIKYNNCEPTLKDIWINENCLAHFTECDNEKSPAKSYIYMKDEYSWKVKSVAEKPEDILRKLGQ